MNRARSLADVRSVDHFSHEAWAEVLQKRNVNRWRNGGGGDDGEEVVIKEVGSLRDVSADTGRLRKHSSGIALNSITLTVANESDDSDDSDDDDDDDGADANGDEHNKEKRASSTRKVHLLIETPAANNRNVGGVLGRPGTRSEFLKESFWYTRAQPILSKRHAVLSELFPTCLHGSDRAEGGKRWKLAVTEVIRSRQGVVIFEDPKMEEFRAISDRAAVPSFGHVKLVLEALAHFHGAWWQYLNAEGQFRYRSTSLSAREVEAFYGGVMELEMSVGGGGGAASGGGGGGLLGGGFRSAARIRPKETAALIKECCEDEDKEKMERVAARLEICDAAKRIKHHCRSAQSSELSTICHGDVWNGNVLYRTDGLGNALKAKLTNLHAMAKGHPADDIAYFLYTSTGKGFRDIYLDLCLRTYFTVLKELGNAYATFGYVDCKLELSFDDFAKQFEERRELGILRALLCIPDILSPKDVEQQQELEQQQQQSSLLLKSPVKIPLNFANKRRRPSSSFHPPPPTQENNPLVKEIRNRLLGLAKDIEELNLLV